MTNELFEFFLQLSGDKPVFVESVKPNGAAYKAGLVATDVILEASVRPFIELFWWLVAIHTQVLSLP